MRAAHILILFLLTFAPSLATAEDQLPPKLLRDIECFKSHGLIQGTVTEAMRGDAHFAVYFKETKIGGRSPGVRFNGAFIEGRTKISPDVVKQCNPNITLEKNSPQ